MSFPTVSYSLPDPKGVPPADSFPDARDPCLNYSNEFNRLSVIFNSIPHEQKPIDIREIQITEQNLEKIENFLRDRDTLLCWQEVIKRLPRQTRDREKGDAPNFEMLTTLEAYAQKAREFENWIDQRPFVQRLDSLELNNRNLSTIPKVINKLTGLLVLYLNQNQIRKIENLDKLVKLRLLSLKKNQIPKIEGLTYQTELMHLFLSTNQIREIKGLEKLTLKKLSLKNNQIRKIERLNNQTKLEHLNLSANQIQKMEGLEKQTKVTWLDLSKNQIEALEGFEGLENLLILDMRKNHISAVAPGLCKLKKLQILHLDEP